MMEIHGGFPLTFPPGDLIQDTGARLKEMANGTPLCKAQ